MDWARAEIPGAGKGLSLEQPGNSRACQCVIGACVDQFSNLCQSRRPWGTDCSEIGVLDINTDRTAVSRRVVSRGVPSA